MLCVYMQSGKRSLFMSFPLMIAEFALKHGETFMFYSTNKDTFNENLLQRYKDGHRC